MPPQIAILGWGSLLWEGGADFDRWHDEWRNDGPLLRLEFSRVSRSRLGALTLVVDPEHGSPTTVAWCLSKRKDPLDTVADLRCREGCMVQAVARLNLPVTEKELPNYDEASVIAEWAATRKIDVVVWTALTSNFETEVKTPFSVAEAIAYIKRLPRPSKVRAVEYMWRAPDFVRTALRTALEKDPWFKDCKCSQNRVVKGTVFKHE